LSPRARYQVPTRLPGAPRVTILNFQKLLKILKSLWEADIADPQKVAEELALVLSTHGMQRMTARVLATLLFTEQATMTAGEIAKRLQASSGAISGAIKMLTSVGLVERVPAPASRRDHYRLRDNAWAIQYTNQNEVTSAVLKAAEAGIAATEDGSLARQRLTQMRDFYTFLFEEIPALLDRWYQRSGSTET
jgi:DNA-binding transcriptional regulator GbsR (MarR family)